VHLHLNGYRDVAVFVVEMLWKCKLHRLVLVSEVERNSVELLYWKGLYHFWRERYLPRGKLYVANLWPLLSVVVLLRRLFCCGINMLRSRSAGGNNAPRLTLLNPSWQPNTLYCTCECMPRNEQHFVNFLNGNIRSRIGPDYTCLLKVPAYDDSKTIDS
jgi:hypothetical protein